MATRRPMQEVDPLSLPVGMKVGPWRVKGWRGRGAYGTLYRVEREGREEAGAFVLKLAIHPRDERFAREAWLLSRIQSPHVPRLHGQGVWEHLSGAFPFVVMEWVAGEPLYEWAGRRNPSSRQVLGLLAQVARALEATHAVGGVHRDVKGANVLVRPADGRAFLTDFGAGHYRGAATLTSRLLPPGTPAYRSPEAWAFLGAFLRHPTAHYPASACDDLFALGVTAYRLVTDEYPPPTHPEEAGAEVWREGGPGPRSPRELNPRVIPELETLIQRLLAIAPGERFNGRAREAAEALERAEKEAGPEADSPLFIWGHEQRPCWRSPGGARLAADQDEVAREEFERRRAEERTRAALPREQAWRPVFASARRVGGMVALLGVLLAMMAVRGFRQEREAAQAASSRHSFDSGLAAVGDSAQSASAAPLAPEPVSERVVPAGQALPEKALPGQRKPPCKSNGEVEIRGGCWVLIDGAQPPCEEYAYDWKGACYLPLFATRHQPSAEPQ